MLVPHAPSNFVTFIQKNKVKEKIPNQTASQSLSGLIVQGREEQLIRKEQKLCVVFHHEDFGGQLIWVLQRYTSIDIEGPSATFFEVEQQQTGTGAAGGGTGPQQQVNQQDNGDTSHQQQQQEEIENDLLLTAIQEIMECGGVNLDRYDEEIAVRELPMVDDDNEPAPENHPTPGAGADAHIFSGWEHSGVCCR